jgi:hypothetical protein
MKIKLLVTLACLGPRGAGFGFRGSGGRPIQRDPGTLVEHYFSKGGASQH